MNETQHLTLLDWHMKPVGANPCGCPKLMQGTHKGHPYAIDRIQSINAKHFALVDMN